MRDHEVKDMCTKLRAAFGRRLPDDRIDDMVNRFLSWKLPNDFNPDCGIEFTPLDSEHCWPVGTNLFTADQAKEMIKHVIFGEIDQENDNG